MEIAIMYSSSHIAKLHILLSLIKLTCIIIIMTHKLQSVYHLV